LCNYDYTPWGGDSWKTIYDRLTIFLRELKDAAHDGNVVCVTSAGVIRMTYKILFEDKAPHISKHIKIENGSVHEFIY
jgi:broad specificity phosphatase PhoE